MLLVKRSFISLSDFMVVDELNFFIFLSHLNFSQKVIHLILVLCFHGREFLASWSLLCAPYVFIVIWVYFKLY